MNTIHAIIAVIMTEVGFRLAKRPTRDVYAIVGTYMGCIGWLWMVVLLLSFVIQLIGAWYG